MKKKVFSYSVLAITLLVIVTNISYTDFFKTENVSVNESEFLKEFKFAVVAMSSETSDESAVVMGADVSVTKSDTSELVAPDSFASYSIVVTNNDEFKEAENVKLIDSPGTGLNTNLVAIEEDNDDDNDGVLDVDDICPGFDDMFDSDGDNVPDGCDIIDDVNDSDNDGVANFVDECPDFDDNIDTDDDGVANGCDEDDDNDGLVDVDDTDDDNDGLVDEGDICHGFDDALDSDGDNVSDGCDIIDDVNDSDNDGVPNNIDECPNFDDNIDTDMDGVANGCDEDDDNDGLNDTDKSVANVPDFEDLEICFSSGLDLICNLGNFAPGESKFIAITLRVESDVHDSTILENKVTVISANDPDLGNNFASVQGPRVSTADLSIEKTASVTEIGPGGKFEYIITVTNLNDHVEARGVSVNDDLGPTHIIVEASSKDCTFQLKDEVDEFNAMLAEILAEFDLEFSFIKNSSAFCDLGTIPPGQSKEIRMKLQVNPEIPFGHLSNSATVGAANIDGMFRQITILGPEVAPIPAVIITTPLDGSDVEFGEITFLAKVTFPDDGSLDNDVEWRIDPSNAVLETGTEFITNSLDLGEHTIRAQVSDFLMNTGEDAITINVVDTEPPVLDQVSDITVQSETVETEIFYGIPNATDNYDPDPEVECGPPGNIFLSGIHEITCTATDSSGNESSVSFNVIVESQTNLSIEKEANVATISPGETFSYTITVKNHGDEVIAENVLVSDSFQSTTEGIITGVTEPCIQSDDFNFSCELGELGPQDSFVITVEMKVDDSAQIGNTLDNSVLVSTTSFETDEFTNSVLIQEPLIIEPPPVSDLELEKSVNIPNPTIGEHVTFTLTVTNKGPEAVDGVKVSDKLPDGLNFVSAIPAADYNSPSGEWDVGTVLTGATNAKILDIVVEVTTSDFATNSAEITESFSTDPNSTPGNSDPKEDDFDDASIIVEQTFAGDGQSEDINNFMVFVKPKMTSTEVKTAQRDNEFNLIMKYGETIDPDSLNAVLNGQSITDLFNPQIGQVEDIIIPLDVGNNILTLSIEGIVPDGSRFIDTDRLNFDVLLFGRGIVDETTKNLINNDGDSIRIHTEETSTSEDTETLPLDSEIKDSNESSDDSESKVTQIKPSSTGTPSIEKPTPKTESPSTEKVPLWIKNNARWWADNQIKDSDFILGIQYLVEEKVIVIPSLPEQTSENAQDSVPDWVRNNADWWSDDLISESEFLNAIKYLIEQGIIKVKS